MCLNPIRIKYKRGPKYASEFGNIVGLSPHISPSTEYIEVGCNTCPDCRNTYYNSLLQRALVESYTSYMFFITLTYDNKHIPSMILPNGRKVFYADYEHIKDMFKRFRLHNHLPGREWRYLCVNEYGDTNHRPHFHVLLFVAKRQDDSRYIPEFLEREIFDNLGKYFAVNVGTKKAPKYDPLFTYSQRISSTGRLMSNYYVKYVCPEQNDEYLSTDNNSTFVKTIRYLIGYINKGGKFADTLTKYLTALEDKRLRTKLSNILRCRVYMSKGFGCGFDEFGNKVYLPKISVRRSLNKLYYDELMKYLPRSVEEFADIYPDQFEELQLYRASDFYRNYDSIDSYLNMLGTHGYNMHCLYMIYYRHEFSDKFDAYFRHTLQPKISTFFSRKPIEYKVAPVYTSSPIHTKSYHILRNGVEQGIKQSLPYLAFILPHQQSAIALCLYYKERICTVDDYYDMYKSIGVSNYEEWISQFRQSLNTKKRDISAGNKAKYDDITCLLQKNCIDLHPALEGVDLYRSVL